MYVYFQMFSWETFLLYYFLYRSSFDICHFVHYSLSYFFLLFLFLFVHRLRFRITLIFLSLFIYPLFQNLQVFLEFSKFSFSFCFHSLYFNCLLVILLFSHSFFSFDSYSLSLFLHFYISTWASPHGRAPKCWSNLVTSRVWS